VGRYYSGDIEGKMWFAVQESNDADNFGVIGEPSNDLYYHFNEDNIRGINKELAKCRESIGTDSLEIMDRYFKKHRTESHQALDDLVIKIGDTEYKKLKEYYARIELGEQILACIRDNDECNFSVEC
jgi:hypothetical protein